MIPDFQTIMLPLMESLRDGKEHSLRETITTLSELFQLTDEDRKTLLPSGLQPVMDNRVGWARTYLKNAGLVEPTRRGYITITKRGIDVLKRNPSRIDVKFLGQFAEFKEFQSGKASKDVKQSQVVTPEESIELAVQSLTRNLADELLSQTKKVSSSRFEHIVLDLLLALGYGGSRSDAAKAIGRGGDGGIDGFIREDRLGLDTVYVQAKRWEGSVSRPVVQGFVGALTGKGNKGVMITTSSFSSEAKDYAERIANPKVILIEGQELARLMVEHNIGVSPVRAYEVKRIDTDYFESFD